MPRFYFNTEDQRDREGTELESLAIAKCQAITLAGRLICEAADTFWDKAEWSLTVTNETGLTLFQLSITGTEAPVLWSERTKRAASASPTPLENRRFPPQPRRALSTPKRTFEWR